MASQTYPKVLLSTLKGDVKITSEHRFDSKLRYDSEPVQVVIAEVMPETYGIVIRKCDPDPLVIYSVVIDEETKFGCSEFSRLVTLMIYDDEVEQWVDECSLDFDGELDWLECVRLLNQAKSQIALRKIVVRQNLARAVAAEFGGAQANI
ncbi:hypothetical protein K466DRAFT_604828 [Polyporus arcularius HHB13444]|uniref:Uncharacterized protein n=1 Tax=Polyporus arcularius HHB13444 TaxID=1314778 RepID=A0A5C3P5H1_9APHY|nr:hypothetical protein K466DRAFT_604828 [Polyporus arcularius HHB13444]